MKGHRSTFANACARKKRKAQMEAILNIEEPEFSDSSELSAEFDIEDANPNICVSDLTYYILNYDWNYPETDKINLPWFMNGCQYCFKEDAKWYGHTRLWYSNTVNQMNEENLELAEAVKEKIVELRNIIRDRITQQYFLQGSNNKLEILKRRYRTKWGDKIEHDVAADVRSKNETTVDGNITINFLTKE